MERLLEVTQWSLVGQRTKHGQNTQKLWAEGKTERMGPTLLSWVDIEMWSAILTRKLMADSTTKLGKKVNLE